MGKSFVNFILLGLISALTLPSGAQELDLDLPDVSLVESAKVADVPAPRIGEVREFVSQVATLNCARWEIVESDLEGYLVSQCGEYKIYLKKDASYNMHKITANGKLAVEFKPFYPVIEFPLKVGKKWQAKYAGNSIVEDAMWDGNVKCEVADFTDVEVAAGVFKAYRIECQDRWKAAGMESSVNSTTWYVPDGTGVVKSITYEDPRWNTELKSFTR